jgi:hypothetical protein
MKSASNLTAATGIGSGSFLITWTLLFCVGGGAGRFEVCYRRAATFAEEHANHPRGLSPEKDRRQSSPTVIDPIELD